MNDKLKWAEEQGLVKEMEDCQQDPEYHQEGDVWTHTKMVYNEIDHFIDKISMTEKEILQWVAIFHDSAKPETTKIGDDGRLHSYNHSIIGAKKTRRMLNFLPYLDREVIVSLVRYHGRPPLIIEQSDIEKSVIDISFKSDPCLLYYFAIADAKGRRTDNDSCFENIDLWKEVCVSLDCFKYEFPFPNNEARFQYFNSNHYNDKSVDYVKNYTPYDRNFEVIMMSGVPSSGKSFWAEKNIDLPVVSLDRIRKRLGKKVTDNQGQVIQMAKEDCKELLRKNQPFVFDATNLTREIRSKWTRLFNDYLARIKIIYVERDMEVMLASNRKRKDQVPEDIILKLHQKMDFPILSECHEIEYIFN